MGNAPTLWLTRPREDSEPLASILTSHGIHCLVAPVMEIRPVVYTLPHTQYDALVLTSRHAARIVGELPVSLRSLPVYCVGKATAEAARTSGASTISAIAENMEVLRTQLPSSARMLYLAGEHITHALECDTVTVYRAAQVTELPDDLIATLSSASLAGAVFFSSRSAALAIALLRHYKRDYAASTMAAYCISDAVARTIEAQNITFRAQHISPIPTQAAIVDLILSTQLKTML